MHGLLTRLSTLAMLSILLVGAAPAQEVGTVAVAEGSAEIGRNGAWEPAAVGMTVARGDELRTGTPGALQVVFQDDSVLNLAAGTHLVVDEQVFEPTAGRFWSVFRMLEGKARAAVSGYYGTKGAAYEIETPTAVAGVRGTTFLVAFDPATDATEVLGIDGTVEVRSLADRLAEGVFLSSQETTLVARDGAPTAPQPIEDRLFRQQLEGLELGLLRGIGAPGDQLVATGAQVPVEDRAPLAPEEVNLPEFRDLSDTIGQPIIADRGRLGVPF